MLTLHYSVGATVCVGDLRTDRKLQQVVAILMLPESVQRNQSAVTMIIG